MRSMTRRRCGGVEIRYMLAVAVGTEVYPRGSRSGTRWRNLLLLRSVWWLWSRSPVARGAMFQVTTYLIDTPIR